jgi:regulator of replication initiation timing
MRFFCPLHRLQEELEAAKAELQEMKDELKSAVKREASKALELSRAQQDLLLAEKASTKLQAERDDLAKKVSLLLSAPALFKSRLTAAWAAAAQQWETW